LNHLLENELKIVRSPRSYNSQVGVPLSIWQMNDAAELAIMEAGISKVDEMEKLAKMIRPDIGIFTNIGDAHNEGFKDIKEKIREKLKLFQHVKTIIYNMEPDLLRDEIRDFGSEHDIQTLGWGFSKDADLQIISVESGQVDTVIRYRYQSLEHSFLIPFTGKILVDNAMTCVAVLELLGKNHLLARMADLPSISMRLEMRNGINHCTIINDSYSADISSLRLALDFLKQQQHHDKRTLILSDLLQSGKNEEELYEEIAALVRTYEINRFIGIGKVISDFAGLFRNICNNTSFYLSTADFVKSFSQSAFHNETILVKGARTFAFEQINQLLESKWHQTVLQIDLAAVSHNLKVFQDTLDKATKIMVMVKAFSYGSGSYEIANLLQFHKVDHLAVAYADEGVELRKAGINLPIMVMNPEEATFASLVNYDLQPEIFSFGLLNLFSSFLHREGIREFPVHVKIDTGMHRLGFEPNEIPVLIERWPSSLRVVSVFTHLAGSEDSGEDAFTTLQAETFTKACMQFEERLGYRFIRHISNTAAISRHRHLQMEMVRLGIGLYGVDTTQSGILPLREAAVLTSTVAQVRKVKKGDTVGYNRRGKVTRDSVIATIRIGYADGYPRSLSNGVGKVLIRNRLFPVVGSVCMDMTMIDVTDLPEIEEGEEVVVFGRGLTLNTLAEWAGTIPYDIMTGISQRVKRVYFED
jgi:Alr-MurF fusion protein